MKEKNMTARKRIKWILLMSIFSLVLSQAVWAAEDDVTVLDTVIVTDSGSKIKLLDTNASISVLTEKDIKNSGQIKASELISSIPGVINQKAGSKTYFSIRGTRSSLSGGPTIYVDGRPINTGQNGYSKIDTIPLDNIEKIEVIKSPPASKYGLNAARGVILITTKTGKSAEDTTQGFVSADYGSWNTVKATAGISGKKGKYDYSISAYEMETDGYRGSDDETKTADGQVGYKFDGGHLDFLAGYNNSFTKYVSGLPYWQIVRDRTVATCNTVDGGGFEYRPSETDQEMFNVGLKFDYDKNNLLFNGSLTYTQDNEIYTEMQDFYNPVLASKQDDYQDDRDDQQYDIKLSGGKVFGSGNLSDTLTLGVDYKYNDVDQVRAYPFNSGALTPAMVIDKEKADIEGTRKFFGANLNNDFSLERFRLQTGLRLNNVKYELSNKVPASVKADYDCDPDWSISPSLRIVDNGNLFITYNHSNYYLPIGYYKYDMQYDHAEAQAKDLKPEVYDTVEAGFKHQLHKALNYSIIYYYTQIDDKIVSFYDGTSFKGYRNAGNSIHQGIEAEIDGRPISWIGYRLNFTTIDAEWDSGWAKTYTTPTSGTTTLTNLSGKKVNSVPEYEYMAGVDFYPFQNKPYGSLILSLDVHGFGRQYEDYTNNLEMPSAHFVDMKLAWTLGMFECYLNCTNLFDKEWDKVSNATGKAHNRFTSPSTSGFYPQDGRYIGIGASYKF